LLVQPLSEVKEVCILGGNGWAKVAVAAEDKLRFVTRAKTSIASCKAAR